MSTPENHLALAQRHVQEGEQRVAKQRVLVAELACGGHDIALAQDVLESFEATLTLMQDHLHTLQSQHNEPSAGTSAS